MRLETFIRKSLGMKAYTVVKAEEQSDGSLVARVDRLPGRRLCCEACGRPAAKVATTRHPERRWRDLALRDQPLWLVYAPHCVWCPTCGLRVERIPWAEQWQRVTHALARAVAALARKLDWSSVATHFRLNWKTVASVVEAAGLWGLAHRRWVPLHIVGIDEVEQWLTLQTAGPAAPPPLTLGDPRLTVPVPRPNRVPLGWRYDVLLLDAEGASRPEVPDGPQGA